MKCKTNSTRPLSKTSQGNRIFVMRISKGQPLVSSTRTGSSRGKLAEPLARLPRGEKPSGRSDSDGALPWIPSLPRARLDSLKPCLAAHWRTAWPGAHRALPSSVEDNPHGLPEILYANLNRCFLPGVFDSSCQHLQLISLRQRGCLRLLPRNRNLPSFRIQCRRGGRMALSSIPRRFGSLNGFTWQPSQASAEPCFGFAGRARRHPNHL